MACVRARPAGLKEEVTLALFRSGKRNDIQVSEKVRIPVSNLIHTGKVPYVAAVGKVWNSSYESL